MKIIAIVIISLLNGQNLLDYLKGPITMKVGLINGYDDNVLRFSDIEKRVHLKEPINHITKRILEEISGETRINIFVKR